MSDQYSHNKAQNTAVQMLKTKIQQKNTRNATLVEKEVKMQSLKVKNINFSILKKWYFTVAIIFIFVVFAVGLSFSYTSIFENQHNKAILNRFLKTEEIINVSQSDKFSKQSKNPVTNVISQNASYEGKKNLTNVFDQTPQKLYVPPLFKHFLWNHAHFLVNKNAKTVLELNSDEKNKIKYTTEDYYKNLTPFFAISNDVEKYDWIVLYYDKENPKNLAENVKKYCNLSTKGASLSFKTHIDYNDFWYDNQYNVKKDMQKCGFFYEQIVGLNLRRREGRVLLIFNPNPKKNSREYSFGRPPKNKIAIQTVYKPNENMAYLREWIGYHIHTGVDKFFLYDNNGTFGQIRKETAIVSSTTQTKNKFPLSCMNYSTERQISEMYEIWQQFYEHIVYVPWQYMDRFGRIFYAQPESLADYINNFEDVVEYTAFTDLDQMIFSPLNLNLYDYLSQKSSEGYSIVRIVQRKYHMRVCEPRKRILDMRVNYEVTTQRWAPKQIAQNRQYIPGVNIHTGLRKQGEQYTVLNTSEWGLRHYNTNQNQIKYAQLEFGATDYKLNIDTDADRYKPILDQICQGKCSENFQVLPVCDVQNRMKCLSIQKYYFFKDFQPKAVKDATGKEIVQARFYTDLMLMRALKQMPFCIFSMDKLFTKEKLINKKFKNVTFVPYSENQSYQTVKDLVKQKCYKNSILMFLNSPIEDKTLFYLNQLHQIYQTYATYEKNAQNHIFVYSFYSRVFDLLELNDFDNSNKQYLQKLSPSLIATGIVELAGSHFKTVNSTMISPNVTYLTYNRSESLQRSEYQKLFKLSQDYEIDIRKQQNFAKKVAVKTDTKNRTITIKMIKKSVEFQDLVYLPVNHAVSAIEEQTYVEKYRLDKRKQISRFCIFVFADFDVQANQVRKNLRSITQQNYTNYYIVFVDNASPINSTLVASSFLKELKFPNERVSFVRNLQKVTKSYSILNVAYNLCKQNQIMVTVNVKDEIIGRFALQTINSRFEQDKKNLDRWFIFTNFINNQNTIGITNIQKQPQALKYDKRPSENPILYLQSFKVKLLFGLTADSQKDQNGNWFNTRFQSSITYPLIEMTGLKRLSYIRELLYFENTYYKKQTQQQQKSEQDMLKTILSQKPFSQIQTLDNLNKDQSFVKLFKQDSNVKYIIENL